MPSWKSTNVRRCSPTTLTSRRNATPRKVWVALWWNGLQRSQRRCTYTDSAVERTEVNMAATAAPWGETHLNQVTTVRSWSFSLVCTQCQQIWNFGSLYKIVCKIFQKHLMVQLFDEGHRCGLTCHKIFKIFMSEFFDEINHPSCCSDLLLLFCFLR